MAGSDCFVPAPNDEDTDPCPPWFIQQEIAGDTTTAECSCGPPTHGVICDAETCSTSLHTQYYTTYNPVTRTQVVGFCYIEIYQKYIIDLPSNVSELNDFMCGHFNSLFLASASQQQLWVQIIQKVLITFYGVWNLDFFYSVIPPFCLSCWILLH